MRHERLAAKRALCRGGEEVRLELDGCEAARAFGKRADAEAPEEPADGVLDAVDLDPDYVIWTEPRASALMGLDENLVPIFERQALHGDRQNDRDGLPSESFCRALFGPIPVHRKALDPAALLERMTPCSPTTPTDSTGAPGAIAAAVHRR